MAEIHFSVSSDYKEVIRLRQEIGKLETQLKKMDVNKSPDIAKALESQLKSTYDQYKEIVSKIAESEAQIKLSSDNIIKNTKKIVEAQEKLSNAANTSSPSPGSTGPDTSSIQAQAKAYEELKQEINKVNGSLLENMKIQQESNNAVRIYREELKKIETNRKKRGVDSEYTKQETQRIKQLTLAIERNRIARNESGREIRTQIKIHDAASGSLNEMRQQLIRMKQAYSNMTDLGSKSARELLASIQQSNTKISEIEQSMGVFSRNVGNYSSGWNGLGMSIQQIARELPTLSMGANMFFLAISNNLPILADELKRAKDEYKSLVAQGQKATPVWKQAVSSIFSWQTALTVGITLLTVYGKDVVEFVSGLFNAEKQLDATARAQKALNEAQLEGIKNVQSELIKLKLLRSLAEDESKHRSERLKAVSKLQSMYPSYLGNIDKEKILAGQVSDVYYQLTTNLKNAAIAKAKFDKAVSVAKEAEELKDSWAKIISETNPQFYSNKSTEELVARAEELKKEREKTQQAVNEAAAMYGRQGSIVPKSNEEEALENILKAYNEWQKKVKELESISKGVDVSGLIYNPDDEKRKIEEAKRQAEKSLKIREKIADELLKLQATNQQREIDLMKEGTEKKIAQINLDYKEQIEAIKKQADAWAKEQGGSLTSEQNMQISIAYSLAKKTRNQNMFDVFQERLNKVNKDMNDYLKEYGNYQEKRLAIAEEYNRKIAESTTEGEKLALRKQLENTLKELDFSQFKTSINFADIFGNLDAQTTSSLTSLRDKLQEYISEAAKDLRPEDLKELQDAFSNINLKIADRQPFKELKSGLEDYKTAQEAVTHAQEDLNSIINGGVVIGELYEDENGNIVETLLTQEQAEKNLAKAQSDRQKTVASLNQSLNAIGAKGMDVVNSGNLILDMLDSFGIQVPEAVSGAMEGLGQVMGGLESIDITKPFSAVTGAIKVVTGLGKTIGSVFGLGGKSKAERDSERLAKVTDKIAQTNEIINNLIENRISLIKQANAAEREGLKESSLDIIDRQRKMMETQFQKLLGNELLGKKGKNNDLDVKDLGISSIQGLVDFLNSDKLVELMENGYGITDKDKWYGIVDEWEKLNEQADQLKETVSEINTGIKFDEARDGLDDLLLSADTTFRDISDNFEGYMRKSILNMVKSRYLNEEMQKWYDQFEQRTSDEVLSREDTEALRQQYENIYNEAQNKINGMLAAAGVGLEGASAAQESSKKGFATASQDQIEELNGRFTAGQIAWEETKNQSVMQNEKLSILDLRVDSLVRVSSDQKSIADETRTILANSYLELQEISENTELSAKYLKDIKADISDVKRNTAGLAR